MDASAARRNVSLAHSWLFAPWKHEGPLRVSGYTDGRQPRTTSDCDAQFEMLEKLMVIMTLE
jgi:hypothetical protein